MEAQSRNQILQRVNELLSCNGFETSDVYNQGCFNIAARKKLLLLFLKILTNIDSINESHTEEIKKVATTFLASPLIVGIKSRNYELKEDVVYDRSGIPAIGIETLENIILYDEYPEFLADRGGYFVNINGNLLREYREEYSLSLKDLADLAHVSRETIYKYENGMVRANSETAILLEDVVNTKITVDIDLFEVPEEVDRENFLKNKDFDNSNSNNRNLSTNNNSKMIEKSLKRDTANETKTKALDLSNLGFGVIETRKTPFDALAKLEKNSNINSSDRDPLNYQNESPLIASLEKNRASKTLHKIAISLKDLSLITNSKSFFIINNNKIKESLDGIPVIKSWELQEAEDSIQFLKMISERQEN